MTETLDFANCDHEAAAHAIIRGLTSRGQRSYLIHTSGSLILATETIQKKCYGELLPKVFNDWDGVHELVSQPDEAAHRAVDKIVLTAASPFVHTAIVCPPTIYGPGRGPDNQRSMQVYDASKAMFTRKSGFLPGKAENIWNSVHVQDLSDLYLLLGEAAAAGGGKASWGSEEGYYLAENGDFVWGDIFRSLAKIAYKEGLIMSEETPVISMEEADNLRRHARYTWGTNSRGQSIRGRKLLGWKPHRRSLEEELPDIVRSEAKVVGLVQSHAAKVTE